MTPWADSSELQADITALMERFSATPEGAVAAEVAGRFGDGLGIELTLYNPDVVLQLDVAAGTVVAGPCKDAAVRVALPAADMHDLLLDRLGPVEISRLVEEQRLHLTGSPPVLCAAVALVARLQPHYEASLRERGREQMLATPAPAIGEIWESAEKPPPLYGVRRPWQPAKGARVTT